MSMAIKTGVRLGVMKPDPKKVVFATHCLCCGELLRRVVMGNVGQEAVMKLRCGLCGQEQEQVVVLKEMDA